MHSVLFGESLRSADCQLTQFLTNNGHEVTRWDGLGHRTETCCVPRDMFFVTGCSEQTFMASRVRLLRSERYYQPIICIAKRYSLSGTVSALNAGADDVVSEDVHSEELLCRISAAWRRSQMKPFVTTRLIGNIYQDLPTGTITGSDTMHKLTTKECEILDCLAEHQEECVSRERLMHRLYGVGDRPNPQILNVYMCKLRRKLHETSGGPVTILCIRDIGYMLSYSPEPISINSLSNRKYQYAA